MDENDGTFADETFPCGYRLVDAPSCPMLSRSARAEPLPNARRMHFASAMSLGELAWG